MIFKVLFQDLQLEAPVRERTKSLYLEANSVREVRQKLSDHKINIEYIQQLDPAHLTYEQQSDDFKVENV